MRRGSPSYSANPQRSLRNVLFASKDWTDGPRREFFVADPLSFAFCLLATRYRDDLFEDLFADFFDSRPVQDSASVDIHVVDHVVVHRRVCGNLDARHRFAAEAASSTGREESDVGTAGDHSGHGNRVEARRIHHDKALLGDRLGIVVDTFECRAAAFGDGSQRLFVDRRQAALLVSNGRVVVDRAAKLCGVLLPPVDQVDQLLPDLFGNSSPSQQMLTASDLGRFGEDRSRSVGDE